MRTQIVIKPVAYAPLVALKQHTHSMIHYKLNVFIYRPCKCNVFGMKPLARGFTAWIPPPSSSLEYHMGRLILSKLQNLTLSIKLTIPTIHHALLQEQMMTLLFQAPLINMLCTFGRPEEEDLTV